MAEMNFDDDLGRPLILASRASLTESKPVPVPGTSKVASSPAGVLANTSWHENYNDDHERCLIDNPAGNAGTALEVPPLQIEWEGVSCCVGDGDGSGTQILHDVWGSVRPGEMLAIMGPSGAGKSTLLNYLAGRPSLGMYGSSSGSLTLNGRAPWKGWQRRMAYVMQRDIFFEELTVRDTLLLTALMRGPTMWTAKQKAEEMERVARMLGLESVLDTQIGTPVERGLSGGETKRVSIANELLARPSLLFADEPLTGLDSTRAVQVMDVFNYISKEEHKTILLSVHQPSSHVYKLFDKLTLLAPGGHTVYFADASSAVDYFAGSGHVCPRYWVPTDFFLDLVSNPSVVPVLRAEFQSRSAQMQRSMHMGRLYACSSQPDLATGMLLDGKVQDDRVPFWYETVLLTARGFKRTRRVYLKPMQFVMNGALASVWGLLWSGVARHADTRLEDFVGMVFFMTGHWSWFPMFQGLNNFPPERNVMTKERASHSYSPSAYYFAKVLCELPVLMVLPVFFYAIAFPLFGVGLELWPKLFCISLLNIQVASSISMALSVACFDQDKATVLAIVLMVFMMSSGGFVINMGALPPWLWWVKYCSYWQYSLGLYFQVAAKPFGHEVTQEAWERYSFSNLPVGYNVAILMGFIFVFRLIAYICLVTTKKLEFT